jgi:uncharacterized membrane protein YidH (DUF202 family)
MNRTGSGFIGFGVFLAVVGAIMTFAIKVHTTGFNINTAGVILMVVGVAMVLISVLIIALGSRTHATTEQSIQNTPDGQVRRTESDNWNASV